MQKDNEHAIKKLPRHRFESKIWTCDPDWAPLFTAVLHENKHVYVCAFIVHRYMAGSDSVVLILWGAIEYVDQYSGLFIYREHCV